MFECSPPASHAREVIFDLRNHEDQRELHRFGIIEPQTMRSTRSNMNDSEKRDGTITAILKDSHFLVPFLVLIVGIVLLCILR